VAARIPMMLVPVEGPKRTLVRSETVKNVLVHDPFDGVREHHRDGNTQ